MKTPIVVLDDNIFFSAIIARKLDGYCIDLKFTLDPIECIKSLNKKKKTIFIIDINMPILSGFTVAKLIRKKEETLKLIPNEIILTSADNSYKELLNSDIHFISKEVLIENIYEILKTYK
ncbi:MAG: response regulator [Colwellia sp.]